MYDYSLIDRNGTIKLTIFTSDFMDFMARRDEELYDDEWNLYLSYTGCREVLNGIDLGPVEYSPLDQYQAEFLLDNPEYIFGGEI